MLYQGPQEGTGQEPEPRPDCLGPAPSGTPKGKGTAEPRQGRGHLQDSASRLGVAEGGGQRALHLEEAAHPTSSSCAPEARAAGSSSSGVPAGEALTAALTQTFSPHSARSSRSLVSTFPSPGPPGPEKEEEPLLSRAQSGLVREQDTRSPSSAPKAHSQVQAPSWRPQSAAPPPSSAQRKPTSMAGPPVGTHLGHRASRALGRQQPSPGVSAAARTPREVRSGDEMRPRPLPPPQDPPVREPQPRLLPGFPSLCDMIAPPQTRWWAGELSW